jgi:hypothetical protein
VKELQDNGVECSKMSGRINVRDEERFGRPSVVSDNLVRSVDQKISERRCFTILKLSCEFPQISRTVDHKFSATQKTVFYSETTKMAMNFSITSFE